MTTTQNKPKIEDVLMVRSIDELTDLYKPYSDDVLYSDSKEYIQDQWNRREFGLDPLKIYTPVSAEDNATQVLTLELDSSGKVLGVVASMKEVKTILEDAVTTSKMPSCVDVLKAKTFYELKKLFPIAPNPDDPQWTTRDDLREQFCHKRDMNDEFDIEAYVNESSGKRMKATIRVDATGKLMEHAIIMHEPESLPKDKIEEYTLTGDKIYAGESVAASSIKVTERKPDHVLKSWKAFYQAIADGRKLHDLRSVADRTFKVGDLILLQEYDPFDQNGNNYTGRETLVEVTYITGRETPCAFSSAVLDRDYVILSIRRV